MDTDTDLDGGYAGDEACYDRYGEGTAPDASYYGTDAYGEEAGYGEHQGADAAYYGDADLACYDYGAGDNASYAPYGAEAGTGTPGQWPVAEAASACYGEQEVAGPASAASPAGTGQPAPPAAANAAQPGSLDPLSVPGYDDHITRFVAHEEERGGKVNPQPYIPMSHGEPIEHSGVTFGIGVDVGQLDDAQLKHLVDQAVDDDPRIPQDKKQEARTRLYDELHPFVGKKGHVAGASNVMDMPEVRAALERGLDEHASTLHAQSAHDEGEAKKLEDRAARETERAAHEKPLQAKRDQDQAKRDQDQAKNLHAKAAEEQAKAQKLQTEAEQLKEGKNPAVDFGGDLHVGPRLSSDEAQYLSKWDMKKEFDGIKAAYNKKMAPEKFDDLPLEAQEMIISYSYQHGSRWMGGKSALWSAVKAKDWGAAAKTLRGFTSDKKRRGDEASELEKIAAKKQSTPGSAAQPAATGPHTPAGPAAPGPPSQNH